MSLASHYRLQHRSAFDVVYRNGLRSKGRFMMLRAFRYDSSATDPQLQPSRLGVSISHKVSKRAVIRNRIKRQIKAAFRTLIPQLAAGWWVVIGVNPSAVQCDYEQFLRELEKLLINAEVVNGHSRRSAI